MSAAPAVAGGPGAGVLESALYVGTVRHRRSTPRAHAFRYPAFMVYLDLAELDVAFASHPAFSARGPAPAWFRRADHFGDPRVPLHECVRALVGERTGRRTDGPVRTLAHLRHFGIGMKPASFHYCFDPQGGRVDVVVVEVHNTPWREKHCYVLDARGREPAAPLEFEVPKAFHVSPFMGMDLTYRFRFNVPAARLEVSIEHRGAGAPSFEATLSLERRAITHASLAAVLREHPLATLRVIAGIYSQALRLWWKRIPYHAHPRDTRRGRSGGDA